MPTFETTSKLNLERGGVAILEAAKVIARCECVRDQLHVIDGLMIFSIRLSQVACPGNKNQLMTENQIHGASKILCR